MIDCRSHVPSHTDIDVLSHSPCLSTGMNLFC